MTYRILCVDPDEETGTDTATHIESHLNDMDITVQVEQTLEGATERLAKDLDAVITEYMLPAGTGLDLIARVNEECPDAGCILYTDTDPDSIDTTALQNTVTEYVGKNSVFGAERLSDLLRSTLKNRSQATYPTPQTEAERVAALQAYELDDQTLRSSLDRVTDVVATHFGADIASINIITEHSQEFLSCFGAAEDWETMDREDSICTFTILEDEEVMTVEDVTDDPRFEQQREQLTALGIRSYLGASLVTPQGLAIGSLCVYLDEPNSFSEADKSYMRNMASIAMDLIELYTRVDSQEAAGDMQ